MNLFATDMNNTFSEYQRLRETYILNETHVSQKIIPATGVVIVLSSTEILATILRDMKESIWWNHEALLLIINENANSCQMARVFLRTLWDFNILWATYLCRKRTNQLSLYTFNPYSSLAPIFWRKVDDGILSSENFTLFEHPLERSHFLAYSKYILIYESRSSC